MSGNFFGGQFLGGGFFGATTTPPTVLVGGGGPADWKEAVTDAFRERHLKAILAKEKKQLREVRRKIVKAERKIETAAAQAVPAGILANLELLQVQEQKIEAKIKSYERELLWLSTLKFDDDEDDIEALILQ